MRTTGKTHDASSRWLLTHGPFASLHAGLIHLDAEIARAETSRAPASTADYLHGTACGTVFLVGLCAHTWKPARRSSVIQETREEP